MRDTRMDALDLLGSLAADSAGTPRTSGHTTSMPTPLAHDIDTPTKRVQKKPRVARVPWTEADDTMLSSLVAELYVHAHRSAP